MGPKNCWLASPRPLPFPGRKVWRTVEVCPAGATGGAVAFELLQHATAGPLGGSAAGPAADAPAPAQGPNGVAIGTAETGVVVDVAAVDDVVNGNGGGGGGGGDRPDSESGGPPRAAAAVGATAAVSGSRSRFSSLLSKSGKRFRTLTGTSLGSWAIVCRSLEQAVAAADSESAIRAAWAYVTSNVEPQLRAMDRSERIKFLRDKFQLLAESSFAKDAPVGPADSQPAVGWAPTPGALAQAQAQAAAVSASVAAEGGFSSIDADGAPAADEDAGLVAMEERFRSLFDVWDEKLVAYFNVVHWRRTPNPAWLFISSNYVALAGQFNASRRRELVPFRALTNMSMTGKTSIELETRAPLGNAGAVPLPDGASAAPFGSPRGGSAAAVARPGSASPSPYSSRITFTTIKRATVYQLLEQLWTLTTDFLLERAEHAHALIEANFEKSRRLPRDGALPTIVQRPVAPADGVDGLPGAAHRGQPGAAAGPLRTASPVALASGTAGAPAAASSVRSLDLQRRTRLFSRRFRVPQQEILLFTCEAKHYVGDVSLLGTIQLSRNFLCFAAQDNFLLRVVPLFHVVDVIKQAARGSWCLVRVDTEALLAESPVDRAVTPDPTDGATLDTKTEPAVAVGDEDPPTGPRFTSSSRKAAVAAARLAAKQGPSFQFAVRGPSAYDMLKRTWAQCVDGAERLRNRRERQKKKNARPAVPSPGQGVPAPAPSSSPSGAPLLPAGLRFVSGPGPDVGGPLTREHFQLLPSAVLRDGMVESPTAPGTPEDEPLVDSAVGAGDSVDDPFHDLVARSNSRLAAGLSSSANPLSSLSSSASSAAGSALLMSSAEGEAVPRASSAVPAEDSAEATEAKMKLLALTDTLSAAEQQSPADVGLLDILRGEIGKVQAQLRDKFGFNATALTGTVAPGEPDSDSGGGGGGPATIAGAAGSADMLRQVKQLRRYARVYGCGISMATALPLRALVRRGIPDELRGELWKWMSGASFALELHQGDYGRLVTEHSGLQPKTQAMEEIERDLHRSLPEHPLFQTAEGIDRLRRVLTAYSFFNPVVGYCQSLNIVCALLLVYLDEEDAFWVLATIAENLVPEYYRRSMVGSNVDQKVFQDLVAQRLPRLNEHAASIGLPLVMLSLPWFLCLFVGYVPFDVALRILDCFFLEGPKVLFQVGLAVLSVSEQSMLATNDPVVARAVLRDELDADKLARVAFTEFADVSAAEIARVRNQHKAAVVKGLLEKNKKTVFRELTARTTFDRDHLETLHAAFQTALGDDVQSTLGLAQFEVLFQQFAPWWAHCIPAVPAAVVLRTLDVGVDDDGEVAVDFREFVLLLALLRQPRANRSQMLAFVFRLFDASTGRLSRSHFAAAVHAVRVILRQTATEPGANVILGPQVLATVFADFAQVVGRDGGPPAVDFAQFCSALEDSRLRVSFRDDDGDEDKAQDQDQKLLLDLPLPSEPTEPPALCGNVTLPDSSSAHPPLLIDFD